MDRNRQRSLCFGGAAGVDEGGGNASKVVCRAGLYSGGADSGGAGVCCWI